MAKVNDPWILGISASHNGAVCLLRGDEIVVAIQEERLSRRKRHRISGAQHSLSLDYCLEYAGIRPRDLSLIVISAQGRLKAPQHDLTLNPFLRVKENGIPTLAISHHFAHAVSAFATSGCDESAILVIDGLGSPEEDMSEEERKTIVHPTEDAWEIISLYSTSNTTIVPLEKHVARSRGLLPMHNGSMPKFGSLDAVFAAAAAQIFGEGLETGKVMGLAPYGRPIYPASDFFEIRDGRFIFSDKIPLLFQHANRWPEHRTEYKDLACSAQQALEEAILYLVDHLYNLYPTQNLCYAGGVALNSVANERIIRESKFKNVYIMPAAEDSGPAIGAAYYGLWQLTKRNTRRRLLHDAVGRQYPASAISQAIAETPGVEVVNSTDVISDAADLLTAGKIIGWFQGRSELGTRALGQRSILCDPRRPDGKAVLNRRVKHREAFRSFAPAVLLEEAQQWFEMDGTNPDSSFMLRVCKFKENKKDKVPAVVHIDGTGRIQTVSKEANGRFYDLIKKFCEKTGVPILLNTSFNIMGTPIVESPLDALICLLSTSLDYCVLEDKIVKKIDRILLGLDIEPHYQFAVFNQQNGGQNNSSGRRIERPYKDYVGNYENTGGVLRIERKGRQLKGTYNAQTTSLVKLTDDVFESAGGVYKNFRITFVPNKNGVIDRAIMNIARGEEAVFTYQAQRRLVSRNFMYKCLGEYQIADRKVIVGLHIDGKFTITAPGQPRYALVPGKGQSFDLKNTPGYNIEFKANPQGAITKMIIRQPNGVFLLQKVA